MFEYFQTNYAWNLAIVTALEMGAVASDIDSVCRPLRAVEAAESAVATPAWVKAWCDLGDRLTRQAHADVTAGHHRSAGRKNLRAALYYMMAERPVSPRDMRKAELYALALKAFRAGVELRGDPAEFVEIPYRGSKLPAVFVRANSIAPAPCVIQFNGFDWVKEFNYLMTAEEYARRGIASLFVDQPGSGGALRLNGIAGDPESEKPATACIDYLATRSDVDPSRIGIQAASLGGYYAPRAAAFEKRLKCCVALGAFFDAEDVMAMRTAHGDRYARSVPEVDDQMMWVAGAKSMPEALMFLKRLTLKAVADKITCPLLVMHGGADRQIPIDHGQKTYDAAINSANRKLVVLGPEDGGVEHCSIDNVPLSIEIAADWIADVMHPTPAM
ncbi:MAG TPA: alpha/beta hydrolase [Candidatus Binataceae bacterium]|nr:alpha/beta hydrolase [Candidatus Binataceae bacterium]